MKEVLNLLPCPKCGSNNIQSVGKWGGLHFKCMNCGFAELFSNLDESATEEDYINAWNETATQHKNSK